MADDRPAGVGYDIAARAANRVVTEALDAGLSWTEIALVGQTVTAIVVARCPGTARPPALPVSIPPPLMKIVHKGWLVTAERRTSVAALERYGRLAGRLRGRPWWRGLSARWRRV